MEGDTLTSTQLGVLQSILKENTCGLHKMCVLLLFIDESFQTAKNTLFWHPPTHMYTAPIVWPEHIWPCCLEYSTEIHELLTECVFYYVDSMRILKLAKRPYPDNGTWSWPRARHEMTTAPNSKCSVLDESWYNRKLKKSALIKCNCICTFKEGESLENLKESLARLRIVSDYAPLWVRSKGGKLRTGLLVSTYRNLPII